MSEWLGFAANSGYNGIPEGGQDGLLKRYECGTIFVDEFARLSDEMQVHLLDFAEGQTVTPIGAEGVSFHPDVHLIFATNEDVTKLIRPDLGFRISATVRIPLLAERIEDVFPLARHFLKKTNYRLDSKTWLLVLRYSWPGNVRELQNAIKFGVTRMQVQDPDSFRPPSAPLSGTESETMRESKKVPIPFEVFASHEPLETIAAEIATVSEPEALREVLSVLEAELRAQGYERAKRNQGLDTQIATLLGISRVDMARLRKQVTQAVNASTADEDESAVLGQTL